MSGRDYDVIDTADGKVLASVRHLWGEEPVDCCMCGQPTFSKLCVPFYERAVRTGQSEGGYAPACDPCYRKWEVWDDGKSLAARRKPVHGGYPAPAPKPEPVAHLHVQAGLPLDTMFYQRAFALPPGRYRLFLAPAAPGVEGRKP